ncbi:hypothetical protein SDJN03_11980, partial [Cucurbita argyrosperma subsp. sororia]
MRLKNITELLTLFFLLLLFLFLLPFSFQTEIPTSTVAAAAAATAIVRPKRHHSPKSHDGGAAVFEAQKRRVYTGPNPLHNR